MTEEHPQVVLNRHGKPLAGVARQNKLNRINGIRSVRPAPKGNDRSVTHGARSDNKLAPVREKHRLALKQAYPRLDDRRLALLADRLARIDLASAWLDKQRGIVRTQEGEVFTVVRDLEKWSARAEQVIKEAEAEHHQRAGKVDLALEMSALDQGDENA